MTYTRENPSQDYIRLIEEYKIMHKKGYVKTQNPQNCYDGKSTIWFVEIIKNIIEINNCKNLLDYGSGKGHFYKNKFTFNNKNYPGFEKYWRTNEYFLYDPSYKENSKFPAKTYDCSICIDVLEHIPIQDLSWVIREIMHFTKKIVFFNIACFPASAVLHNGENAHITVKDPLWWHGFFTPIIQDFLNKKVVCYCSLKMKDGIRKYYAFSFNDNFKKYDKKNFMNKK